MKKLIIGNWKMNPQSLKEAEILFKKISNEVKNIKGVEIVLCLPQVFISNIKKINNKKITLGAQNVSSEPVGPFTGEVSASMLGSIGIKYVIVGHSERRSLGETNEMINKKIILALKNGITPVLCIGESVRGHDAFYLAKIKEQLTMCLSGIPKAQLKNIVIAYEPVWALSSTENRHDATPYDFEEMKIYIKKILSDMFGQSMIGSTRIIYGGSANKDNAESFLKIGADGLLPGKASLAPKDFSKIVEIASKIK